MGEVTIEVDNDDGTDLFKEVQRRLYQMDLRVADADHLTLTVPMDEQHLEDSKGDTAEEITYTEKNETGKDVTDSGSLTEDTVNIFDHVTPSVATTTPTQTPVIEDEDPTPESGWDPEENEIGAETTGSDDPRVYTGDGKDADRPPADADLEVSLREKDFLPVERVADPENSYRPVLEVLYDADERMIGKAIFEKTDGQGRGNMKRLWLNRFINRCEYTDGRSWWEYEISARGEALIEETRETESKADDHTQALIDRARAVTEDDQAPVTK